MSRGAVAFTAAVLIALSGCAKAGGSAGQRFLRDVGEVDYSGIVSTPWDVRAASENIPRQSVRDYTLMIYMNGSDLESESGAATADIQEILGSGVDTERVNIIIFTGGTNRWRNNVISSGECALWRVDGGGITKLAGVGLLNMGDAGTLSGFIDFAISNYPAPRNGLVMWDHGGGSIAGYGHDEKFNNSCLSLLEMDYAFECAGLADKRLEFLGFDACLMSTVEVAVVASRYAGYLTASEDLEPNDGWNYACLTALNAVPSPDGAAFGKAVTDAYAEYYKGKTDESVTMAVTDLSGASAIMGAMGNLMGRCSGRLRSGARAPFYALAGKRGITKTFGGGSPGDDGCDMVDIGDMAQKLSAIFPIEAEAVVSALGQAVIYNRHNSDRDISGLSAYYVFGGENTAESLEIYAALGMSRAYTDYLYRFAGLLGGIYKENASAVTRVSFTRVDSGPLLAYEAYRSSDGAGYAVPARLNGVDVDVIVFIGGGVCRTLGTRREDGYIIQKGIDKLKDGDMLSFYLAKGGAHSRSRSVTNTVVVSRELESVLAD